MHCAQCLPDRLATILTETSWHWPVLYLFTEAFVHLQLFFTHHRFQLYRTRVRGSQKQTAHWNELLWGSLQTYWELYRSQNTARTQRWTVKKASESATSILASFGRQWTGGMKNQLKPSIHMGDEEPWPSCALKAECLIKVRQLALSCSVPTLIPTLYHEASFLHCILISVSAFLSIWGSKHSVVLVHPQ